MLNAGLFSSATCHWSTPPDLYAALDAEFHFDDDPCPLYSTDDGLSRSWGLRTYCNPPYGREIGKWIEKGYKESQLGKLVVMLLPSRTDTAWWHSFCMRAREIRFLRGRLKFGGGNQLGSLSIGDCGLWISTWKTLKNEGSKGHAQNGSKNEA